MKETHTKTKGVVTLFKRILIGLSIIVFICISIFTIAGFMPLKNPISAHEKSFYVTMKDGTKIAARVTLPLNLQKNEKIPSIIESTRYGTENQMTFVGTALMNLRIVKDNTTFIDVLSKSKYAYIAVDVRGTGASFGNRIVEQPKEEIEDYGQVIDWIVNQSWSNGKVGTYGISYSANTAELSSVSNNPALVAAAPLYGDFEPMNHLLLPGGLFDEVILKSWSEACASTDSNNVKSLFIKGIKPVDQDQDGKMLKAAIEGHHNIKLYDSLKKVTYFDDILQGNYTANSLSPFNYKDQIEKSNIPLYIRVGWQDAGTVNGAIERFLTYKNSQDLVIGPWSHGGFHFCDPFLQTPSTEEQLQRTQADETIAFFDKYLKADTKNGNTSVNQIKYYTLGEGKWKTTATWPVKGFDNKKLYFNSNGSLKESKPTEITGKDIYKVDFSASTGDKNRWFTNMGGACEILYPNRSEEDKKLLTYTTGALENDVEITGVPVVTLNLSSTATDGNFITYLEDVAPNGNVTYITEGELRALHRKITDDDLGHAVLGPKHSFERKDGELLKKGENAELKIGMYATSVLIKKGHKIRIAIAGHDASVFERIPKDEDPIIEVQRNSVISSYVELPMMIKTQMREK